MNSNHTYMAICGFHGEWLDKSGITQCTPCGVMLTGGHAFCPGILDGDRRQFFVLTFTVAAYRLYLPVYMLFFPSAFIA